MLVVIDTNILISGLRSVLGASNAVLTRLAKGDFKAGLSTALLLEYEDVLNRPGLLPNFQPSQIAAFLDSMCSISEEAYIYFRWRPFLPDPKDDMVFECALACGASHIVTHNTSDFREAAAFGISVVTPREFLRILPPP